MKSAWQVRKSMMERTVKQASIQYEAKEWMKIRVVIMKIMNWRVWQQMTVKKTESQEAEKWLENSGVIRVGAVTDDVTPIFSWNDNLF